MSPLSRPPYAELQSFLPGITEKLESRMGCTSDQAHKSLSAVQNHLLHVPKLNFFPSHTRVLLAHLLF